ncbi:MAG: LapA family protein [Bradymonadales bacterium]|nr:LapA family protein [Bradymonadales bacterium]
MRYIKLILLGILAVLVIVIVLQNTETVQTNILFVEMSMPIAVLLIGTIFIGFLLGYFARVVKAGRPKKKE